jgi:hypothetical protein
MHITSVEKGRLMESKMILLYTSTTDSCTDFCSSVSNHHQYNRLFLPASKISLLTPVSHTLPSALETLVPKILDDLEQKTSPMSLSQR